MLAQLARLLELAAAGLADAFAAWREDRRRVWTVWHGIHPGGGHGVPIAIRKTRAAAERMVEQAPRVRVAIDRRVVPLGPPPVDHLPRTWLVAVPVAGDVACPAQSFLAPGITR